MNQQFGKNIRVLKNAIAERKLVVFAGAGISIDSGMPTWEQLIKELRAEIDIPENESDYLRIAQMYYYERQHKEFVDKIREVSKHKKLRYNKIHEALFELSPEHIITTNFDDLLEQVLKAKAYPYSVIKKDSELPYAHNTKLLVKIHGDLDEGNFTIKEDDYLEYPYRHPLFESFIKGVFANKVVLFVGYSFSDLDLKIIVQNVKNILGHDFQNAYMLNTEENFHHAKRQYLKNKGINVINYEDGGKMFGENYIEQYLYVGRNALKHEFYKRDTSLSSEGNKLLNLLRFIHRYADFAESVSGDNVLIQMWKSLERFEEVAVLPPTFLGNLFPFSRSKYFIFNYFKHTLGSNNYEVSNFFFEYVEKNGFALKETFFINNELLGVNKPELEKKLAEIVHKFIASSIWYFGKYKAKLNLFDHPKAFDEFVEFKPPNVKCDCLRCLLNEFKIKDFLKKLKDSSVTETTEIPEDLLIAYSYYKASNFRESYHLFEEIANKAWQLGKYISYYIAKQNVKHLRNLINWADHEIDIDEKRGIVEKIDEIDLDKLLFQIPNLGGEEYKLLKIVRDDEVLLKSEGRINEYYDKIVGLYKLYDNGGFSSGPYYPNLIRDELYNIYAFYTFNFIVKDEYTNILNVFQKGIHGYFLAYFITDRYEEKVKDFDYWIIKFIILYGNADTIHKLMEDYAIDEIKITEGDISKVIRLFNNLLESFFNESNFLGRNVSLDNNVEIQIKTDHFEDKFRIRIHVALLIYSCIKIPQEYANLVIKNFIDFLTVERILHFISSRFVTRYLYSIKDYITFEDYLKLLEISAEKDYLVDHKFFFHVICEGISKSYPDKTIEDMDLVERIISQAISPKNHKHRLGFMYLWKISSLPNKKLIEDALRKDLKFHFNSEDYFAMCYLGIIKAEEYLEKYIEILDRHTSSHIEWEDGKPRWNDYTFPNFVNFYYQMNISFDSKVFKNFDQYPEFWKFYLNPFKFDYSKFDPMWLLLIMGEVIHGSLKNIPDISHSLKQFLKKQFNQGLSDLYSQFYL